MARRMHVELVRDRLGAVLHTASGMEKGVPDADIAAAVEHLREAVARLDSWLKRTRGDRASVWTRVDENCVIRRKTVMRCGG